MYEATKLRIEDAMHIGWDIITCKITSCKATRTDAGHKSTISGLCRDVSQECAHTLQMESLPGYIINAAYRRAGLLMLT